MSSIELKILHYENRVRQLSRNYTENWHLINKAQRKLRALKIMEG